MRRASEAIRAIAAIASAAMLIGTAPAQPSPAAPAPAVRAGGIPARSATVAGAVTAPALTPTVVPPRMAFTDDRDQVVAVPVNSDQGPQTVASGPRHAGEASVAGDAVAFVSTADDPNGEVYLRTPALGADGAANRVTCDNNAIETHPVISPDGDKVAYASNQSGRFQIWVAWLRTGPSPTGTTPSCSQPPRTQVTQAGGESLWPAWADDGSLLFSSTRDDPLGDLFRVPVGAAPGPVPDSAAVRLTDSPAAETQPTAVWLQDRGSERTFVAVVFTTTAYRQDGSLAWLRLPDAGDLAIPEVSSVWPSGSVQQSSEAAFGSQYGEGSGLSLAYRTADRDPYGDVRRVAVDTDDGAWGSLQVLLATVTDVAARPGMGESHPAWARDTDGYTAFVLVTERLLAADVADVVAADGRDRRVLAAGAPGSPDGVTPSQDASSPTYSPEGPRIAYSRSTTRGREIVTADADGSNIRPLVVSRVDGTHDVEPAWSPDGAQIAFVRYPLDPSAKPLLAPQIWVATVATGVARRVSVDAPNRRYWDENPSWSPDGTRLVIARTTEVLRPDLAVALRAPSPVTLMEPFTVAATVTNVGEGSTDPDPAVVRISSSVSDGSPDFGLTATDPRCSSVTLGELVCRLGEMAPDARVSVDLTATGRGSGSSSIRASVEHLDEPDFANNDTSVAVTVLDPPPDLAVTLTLPPAVDQGGTGQSRVTVRNVGGSPAPQVQVRLSATSGPPGLVTFTDSPPPGCTYVSASVVTCQAGALSAGGQVVWDVQVRGETVGTGARVTATADRATGETSLGDNVAVATTTVTSPPPPPPPPPTPTPTPTPTLPPPPGCPPDCVVIGSGVTGAGAVIELASWVGPVTAPRPLQVRAVPQAPPADLPTHLWVIDVASGQGQQVGVPAPPGCGPVPPCRLTPLAGRVPAWSPDGLHIAYEVAGAVRIATLLDTDSNGIPDVPESATTVAAVTGFDVGGSATPNRSVLSAATDPAWSPDGTELAIAGQPAGQPEQQGIYALRTDGTGLRVVASDRGPETEPAWQPYADLVVALVATPASVAEGGGTVLEATVTNDGPGRAASVRLQIELPAGLTPGVAPAGCTLAGQLLACDLGTLAPGASLRRSLPATGPAFGSYVVTAVADSPTSDPVPTNNAATVTVTVAEPVADLAVTVSVTSPGYVGGRGTATFTARNNGPTAATGATLTVSYPAGLVSVAAPEPCLTGALPCALDPLAPGAETAFVTTLSFLAGGSGAATASISGLLGDPAPANNAASAVLVVKTPVMRLMPEVVTPGGVTLASGTDFPPGAKLVLGWDIGLTERVAPVTVGTDGTIAPIQVIVFRRDQLGIRNLLATGTVQGLFGPVQAPLLVAPQRVSPPDFVVRN